MYLYHFGLRQLPFSLTPNTQFYFGLPSHNEALEVLKTALHCGEGFIKVTGEVGAGKSLICRKLLNELSDGFVPAYIPNPLLSPQELRRVVASELQVDLSGNSDQQEFTLKLQQHLINIRRQNKAAILIIDEAQALPDDSLEALRLMTNLETQTSKLIQVVLFGQPELEQKLRKPELRQVQQRITFSYTLKPMDSQQVTQYLRHRMVMAGHPSGQVFCSGACKAISRYSKGTPRLVNVLAHKSLMLAYGEGAKQVSRKHVNIAAKDTESAYSSFDIKRWVMPAAAVCTVLVATMLTTMYRSDYSQLLSVVMGWDR